MGKGEKADNHPGLKNSDKSSWVRDFFGFYKRWVQNTFGQVGAFYGHWLYRVMCYGDIGRLQKDFTMVFQFGSTLVEPNGKKMFNQFASLCISEWTLEFRLSLRVEFE